MRVARIHPAAMGALMILCGLVGCSDMQRLMGPSPEVAQCKDPRPMVCTMEYIPVCANLEAGGTATYPSGCNACADVAVASWVNSPCEEK
jgi:hypothetical protein